MEIQDSTPHSTTFVSLSHSQSAAESRLVSQQAHEFKMKLKSRNKNFINSFRSESTDDDIESKSNSMVEGEIKLKPETTTTTTVS